MNHSHVYNDESRYRCFIYQKQRGNNRGRHHVTDRTAISHKAGNQNNPGAGSSVRINMAMSAQASCLGLWNVHEGYKTFELKKCKYRWSSNLSQQSFEYQIPQNDFFAHTDCPTFSLRRWARDRLFSPHQHLSTFTQRFIPEGIRSQDRNEGIVPSSIRIQTQECSKFPLLI